MHTTIPKKLSFMIFLFFKKEEQPQWERTLVNPSQQTCSGL
jgi:hypothetical protein